MSSPLRIRRSHDRRILPDDQIRNPAKLKSAIVDALAVIAANRDAACVDRLTERILTAWPGFSRA